MSLLTPSQSVSHKRFHQWVNHKKKISLRHPLPSFGSFSFFQASLWLGVDKVLQKLTKSYKSKVRHLFQCCNWIPRKCPRKTPHQHTVHCSGGVVWIPLYLYLYYLLPFSWGGGIHKQRSPGLLGFMAHDNCTALSIANLFEILPSGSRRWFETKKTSDGWKSIINLLFIML